LLESTVAERHSAQNALYCSIRIPRAANERVVGRLTVR